MRPLVEDHLEGRENRRLLLWSLLSFEHWCRTFLGGERPRRPRVRVLVTGAAGFIGSRAARAALGDDHEVVALGRAEPPAELPGGVEWVRAGPRRAARRRRAAREIDAVVHLAQSRALPRTSPTAPPTSSRSTSARRFELLEYARGPGPPPSCSPPAAGSTGARRSRSPSATRSRPPTSTSGRSWRRRGCSSSYAGEFRTVALRPFFVFGPNQPTMMVAGLIRRVQAGEEIAVERRPRAAPEPDLRRRRGRRDRRAPSMATRAARSTSRAGTSSRSPSWWPRSARSRAPSRG